MFEEEFQELENSQSPLTINKNETISTQERTYFDLSSGQQTGVPIKHKDRHFYETNIQYNNVKLPVRIPLTMFPEEVGDVTYVLFL